MLNIELNEKSSRLGAMSYNIGQCNIIPSVSCFINKVKCCLIYMKCLQIYSESSVLYRKAYNKHSTATESYCNC